jgi:hypothetical protein
VLFAVRPLRVESVVWVAERKDVLAGFFWLLGLLLYVCHCRRPGWRRYVPVLGVFALGLLSKPMVVTFPLVLLLLDWWPLGRLRPESASHAERRHTALALVREKLPFLALSFASAAVTLIAQRSGGALKTVADFPLGVRLGNALVSYAAYLGKEAWPAGLAVFYPHPGSAISLTGIVAASLLLSAITAGAIALRRRHPFLLAGWLWHSCDERVRRC